MHPAYQARGEVIMSLLDLGYTNFEICEIFKYRDTSYVKRFLKNTKLL